MIRNASEVRDSFRKIQNRKYFRKRSKSHSQQLSGEKSFVLMKKITWDWLDGFIYYWHNLGYEIFFYSPRQRRFSSAMGSFAANDCSSISIINDSQGLQKYIIVPLMPLLLYGNCFHGKGVFFSKIKPKLRLVSKQNTGGWKVISGVGPGWPIFWT